MQITAGTKVVYQEGIYTVRAVDGNVLELAYHTGGFFRLVHISSVIVCPSPSTQTAPASLPAPADAGQGVGNHSYLWWQVLLTDPVGQWLCVGGRHGCAWSIKRSDEASINRVQRRRA